MKQDVIKMVKDLVGHTYLYFDTALLIKLTPHTWPMAIWGVCVSPSDQVYLMDNAEQWHELKESDVNYSKALNSLYQRVKSIQSTYKTAV